VIDDVLLHKDRMMINAGIPRTGAEICPQIKWPSTRALAKVGRELSEPIKILLRTPYEDPEGRGWWSKRRKVELDVEKMRVSLPRDTHLVI
jgi:hypothetical protein